MINCIQTQCNNGWNLITYGKMTVVVESSETHCGIFLQCESRLHDSLCKMKTCFNVLLSVVVPAESLFFFQFFSRKIICCYSDIINEFRLICRNILFII